MLNDILFVIALFLFIAGCVSLLFFEKIDDFFINLSNRKKRQKWENKTSSKMR